MTRMTDERLDEIDAMDFYGWAVVGELSAALKAERSENERLRKAFLVVADTLIAEPVPAIKEKEWSTWVQLQEIAANLRAILRSKPNE